MHSRATKCKHAFILAILCKPGKGSHVYICARSPAHSHRMWAENFANAWLPCRNYGSHLMPSCTTKPHTICTLFLSIFYWVLAAIEWQVVQKEYRVQHLAQLNYSTRFETKYKTDMLMRGSWGGPEKGLQKQCAATVVLGQVASLSQGKKPYHIKKNPH